MIKPKYATPSKARLLIPAIATIGLVGIVVNSRRSTDADKDKSKDAHEGATGNRARAKRDSDGLSGAGVGGNMQSGGVEEGAGPSDKGGPGGGRVQTTASSRDELPAGGVGGGHGGGNSNTRAVEMRP